MQDHNCYVADFSARNIPTMREVFSDIPGEFFRQMLDFSHNFFGLFRQKFFLQLSDFFDKGQIFLTHMSVVLNTKVP
jgi:hypothetical protein